jgi:Raf kinase inhibitor-like YbhB/YbcL family protein
VKRVAAVLAVPMLGALVMAGCSGGGHELPRGSGGGGITVTSPSFADGQRIPVRFTCDGANEAPPVTWSGASGRGSIVVLMTDRDADGFVHWLLYDLGGSSGSVGGASTRGEEGENDFGGIGYSGPCPPGGSAHRYVITVYEMEIAPSPMVPGESVDQVLCGPPIERGSLTGTYSRA